MLRPLTILAALAAILYGCSDGTTADTAAIPRPRAYPRPVLYAPEYKTVPSAPCRFEVNASADATLNVRSDTSAWLDVRYPLYDATLRCTFTRVSDRRSLERIVDNRTQRMALNLGDHPAEQTDVSTPSGVTAIILTAAAPTVTPVQFLATFRDWVVSGALEMPAAACAPADSLRPVITAVNADLLHAINHLYADDLR